MTRATLVLLVLLGFAVPAASQVRSAAEVEALTRSLAAELRCPVCQGLSLEDSPTELSMEMKGVIREQLAEGRSPAEVKEYFVARYGEWILMEPRPRGFNLLVYVLPVLALLAGGGLVVGVVRRWTRAPAAALAPGAPPSRGREG